MKQRLTALLLAALLLLAGCSPVSESKQESEKKLDFGTNPENLSSGGGYFAAADGYVYTADFGYTHIVEYDTVTGKSINIELPEAEKKPAGTTDTIEGSPCFYSDMFLLEDCVAFIDHSTEQFRYEDEYGKTFWSTRRIENLAIMNLVTGDYTKISELGDYVYKVIPVIKETNDELTINNEDNPLACVELYFSFGYDTFPEMAAQLAQDGITLEEPVDDDERRKYIIDALGYMDGDTREITILKKGRTFRWFHVDDQYIYIIEYAKDNVTMDLYRSRLDEIDFQYMDVGDVGNSIVCHDGGFYFHRGQEQQICYFKDGNVTELPIAGCAYRLWRNQIIYLDSIDFKADTYCEVKIYDLDTGEIKTLCEGASFDIHLLEDKYLGYVKHTDKDKPHIIIDLETGEQIEVCRRER